MKTNNKEKIRISKIYQGSKTLEIRWFLPSLLNIIRLFRESVTLKPAEMSFKKGWEEAMSGETMPLEDLWEGIDAE